jgi:hypothetical protein
LRFLLFKVKKRKKKGGKKEKEKTPLPNLYRLLSEQKYKSGYFPIFCGSENPGHLICQI